MHCLIRRQRMKILITGNAASIFIKVLVKNCLLPENDVTLIRLSDDDSCDYYRNLGCKVLTVDPPLLARNPKIRSFALRSLTRRQTKYGDYDVIHVMQMTRDGYRSVSFANRNNARYIITYFGSDLLREENDFLLDQRQALDKTAFITVPSVIMETRFHQVFGSEYDGKLRRIVLETDILKRMSDVCKAEGNRVIANSKEYYGLNESDVTIAIGYNAFPAQNHIPVIRALSASDLKNNRNIVLLLQLTYGAPSPDYTAEVENALRQSGFRYKIFTDFMDPYDSLRFRYAADIMIHSQRTDAFSASVREHLAADTLVINFSGINYEEYKKASVFYEEFDSIDEIPAIIQRHIAEGKIRPENYSKMMSLFPFEKYVEGWRDIYRQAFTS